MQIRLINSKATVSWFCLAVVVLAVQACGGGGDSSPAQPSSSGSAGTSAPTETTVAAPAAEPAPALLPEPAPAPAPTSTSTTLLPLTAATTCSIPGFRDAVLKEINLARTSGHVCGTEILPPAAPVTWNDILFSAAARHALDMATRGYFAHTTPDGVDFVQRLSSEGYRFSAVGENLAAGVGTVNAAMQTWLGSEPHCRNVMSPLFTEVAVACVAQSGNFWAMELGRP